MRFIGVGIVMTVLNTVVLVLLVSGVGMGVIWANLARTVSATQVRFYLHRTFTWGGEREVALWPALYRFNAIKLFSAIPTQLFFAGMLFLLRSLPYLLVYVFCTAIVGVVNFFFADKLVFRQRKSSV